MGATYTRQSSYTDGDVITAAHTNDEFNQLLAAFASSTGHTHNGDAGEGGPISLLSDSDANNKILIDETNNHLEFYVEVSSSATQQIRIQDGAIVPITDNDIDLGTSSLEFKDLHLDGTANIDSLVADTADINGGTVDNVIIGGSTAAAITGTTLVANTSLNIAGDGATVTGIKDEDDMSSNSATKLATQQSIKAYVDSQVTAQDLDFQADSGGALSIDLDSETMTFTGGTGIDTSGSGNAVTFAIDSTVATLAGTQTFTNKTLTSPIISSISNTGTITLPTSTDTLVGRDTTDTLTNKTLTTPVISSISNTGTITLPTSTDTLVGRATTDTLTNKTLTSAVLNGTISGTSIKDEDDMTSDSASHLATQQSIKAYVDSQVATANELAELTDVNITTPADASLLFYDTLTSKWIDNVVSGDITIADTGVATIQSGAVDNDMLAGSIANAKLANSTVSFGGISLALGASDATPAFDLADATNYPTSSLSGTITNAQLAGSIEDSKLNTISTAGKVDIGALEIDGATDIGADLADADLIIVDDGANGTERKSAMSRVPTYVFSKVSGDATVASNGALTIAATSVENSMLAGSIADTKLNTISTADKVSLSALDIDGASDIGADLTTSDLIVVDDGAGGTNRKAALSRLTTFMQGQGFSSEDPTALAIALG